MSEQEIRELYWGLPIAERLAYDEWRRRLEQVRADAGEAAAESWMIATLAGDGMCVATDEQLADVTLCRGEGD